jgi:hypothetical protein
MACFAVLVLGRMPDAAPACPVLSGHRETVLYRYGGQKLCSRGT